ncbi:hypothetical protein L6164_036991 [Bauhinia variegata]|uniref:Uncharacterized protein n=1 Tax=Bauhinia variegata TaxID=167791 RepID=A0ACB9KIR1_BAUVA|nr:hypothetical protein L6164_036991 [Bauhinia variegata]
MATKQVLHMNGGMGETSYANNSTFQRNVMKGEAFLEESLTRICSSNILPNCFKVADLGCSSGPNALAAASDIINVIDHAVSYNPTSFQIFLNDLPGNDFNTIFKLLPEFYQKLHKEKEERFGPCFIVGMPGTFHGRLFPSNSMDFFHSSYGLHWLSQNKTEESKLDSSDMPYFAPTANEVKEIIELEGSFTLQRLEICKLGWDADIDESKEMKAKFTAKYMRAVAEPLLKLHFGDDIMDKLFQRFADKVAQLLEVRKMKYNNLVISMTKN